MKHRLSRDLLVASVISTISLFLYYAGVFSRTQRLIIRPSSLQLFTLASLALLILCLLIAGLTLYRRADWEAKISEYIQWFLDKPWRRDGLLYLTGLVLLRCIAPYLSVIFPLYQRLEASLFRYLWLYFLLIALVILVIESLYPKAQRRRWIISIALAILSFTAGLWIQAMLLGQLDPPYDLGWGQASLALWVWAFVIWTLIFWLRSMSVSDLKFWIPFLILTAGVFALEWLLLARKLRFFSPYQALYAPVIICGLPLLVGLLLNIWSLLVKKTSHKIEPLFKGFLVCVLILLGWFYFRGALRHAEKINIETSFSDQQVYINFIKTARALNFHYTGDHNRMPGYPFLQALFVRPGMTDAEVFAQGKLVNILLSELLLILYFLIFLRFLGFYQAFLLVLIAAFSLYIFKSPYIQAEITYYFLFFLSFVLMTLMLIKPGWLLAMATGFVAGLAYLTKGSLLPALALFAAIFILKEIISFIQKGRLNDRPNARLTLERFINCVLVLIVFGVVIYPYASQMKKRFGSYFYNVNTSIYIWYDEMQQAYENEPVYHFIEGPPVGLAPDQIPSLRNYLRGHTWSQIYERIVSGLKSEINVFTWQFSVTNYQLDYLWIFLLVMLLDIRNVWRNVRKYPFVIAFVGLFFLIFLAAFAWYTPIASGRRFAYTLYIPYLFSIFVAANTLGRNQFSFRAEGNAAVRQSRFFNAANLLVALTLIYNIWFVLRFILFIDRYGS